MIRNLAILKGLVLENKPIMTQKEADPKFNARAQFILQRLIRRFLRDGVAVGSKTLREEGVDLSPATIRNVMAELEAAGFLTSPHLSAGRVPTEQGIRFFVDSLLSVDSELLSSLPIPTMRLESSSRSSLFDSASNLLSGLTRLAGVVTLPRTTQQSLRQIEFIRLSECKVLAVIVATDDDVQNRIILTQRDYTTQELHQIAGLLNEQLAGHRLLDVREHLLKELKSHQHEMNTLMCSAIQLAEKIFSAETDRPDFCLAGEMNLMDYAELSDIRKLKDLFALFNEKREVLKMLDQCLAADGVQIFIGRESGYEVFEGCSLVTSTYQYDGRTIGALGVIGPTRMAYDRIIPVVDRTAKMLSSALNKK